MHRFRGVFETQNSARKAEQCHEQSRGLPPPEFRPEALRLCLELPMKSTLSPEDRSPDRCLLWHPFGVGSTKTQSIPRPARRANYPAQGGTPASAARGEDPPPGQRDPQKSLRPDQRPGNRSGIGVSVFKLIDAQRGPALPGGDAMCRTLWGSPRRAGLVRLAR